MSRPLGCKSYCFFFLFFPLPSPQQRDTDTRPQPWVSRLAGARAAAVQIDLPGARARVCKVRPKHARTTKTAGGRETRRET